MSFEMDDGQSFTLSETAEQKCIHFMNCETVEENTNEIWRLSIH